ncbi:MAG: ribonuclease III [Acidimicrobiia bacterium]|nr:ribonuclease III [Acidimicrobiia bacterium]
MDEPGSSPEPHEELRRRLGYEFRDPSRLVRALTHRSFCAEQPSDGSNERLEFLGDAVLGIVVTEELYALEPELPEGEMAKARAAVVSTLTLAEMATELRLGPALRLGRGEHLTGGREKPSILADALEAVIGAVHTDGGFEASRPFVLRVVGQRLDVAAAVPGEDDHKTQLQELVARTCEELPVYRLVASGPDHDKHFVAEVLVEGEVRGRGEGKSKKQAEQAAARTALQTFRSVGPIGADVEGDHA